MFFSSGRKFHFFEEKTEEKEEEENEGEEREIDDGVLFEEPEKKEECKLPVIADVGEMGKMMALSHLFHRSLSEKVEGIVLVEGNARFRFDWPLVWSELVEEVILIFFFIYFLLYILVDYIFVGF